MRATLGCDEFVGFEMDPKWQVAGRDGRQPDDLRLRPQREHADRADAAALGAGGILADFLRRFGPGPHHLGIRVDDLGAAVDAAGATRPAMSADFG